MHEQIRVILQGLRITVSVKVDEALSEVGAMKDRARNMHPMLERAAEIMRMDAALQFKVGGVPTWAPLAPSTIAQKRRQGYPRLNRRGKKGEYGTQSMTPYGGDEVGFGPTAVLVRTGVLFGSWTDEFDPDHVMEIDGDTVRIGSSVPYAGIHQTGGGKVPRRAITVTDEAKRQTEREALKYIETGEIEN